MTVTRFAPSPNGALHLGHAYSAIVAHDLAREAGGRFLLRIEDIDGARSRSELAEDFRRDLAWLGLEWDEVPAQSTRLDSYARAAEVLRGQGLLYPCSCTRAEIAEQAASVGPEGPVYGGRCRRAGPVAGRPVAWRLDTAKALALAGPLSWTDAL
ncbi:MAG: tRNA glutamyl-Q(34) synthetase GluQRS, partial [Alphaproteobacteria bacterium]|nr:tRNA glutamyl-Q(34) synthetase GluQRS [Alphaproteobacteria bacterium]